MLQPSCIAPPSISPVRLRAETHTDTERPSAWTDRRRERERLRGGGDTGGSNGNGGSNGDVM